MKLLPGHRISRPLALVAREGDAFFWNAENHRCHFELRDTHAATPPVLARTSLEISVRQDEAQRRDAAALAREVNPKRVEAPVKRRRQPLPVAGTANTPVSYHVALAAATRYRGKVKKLAALAGCLHAEAPEGVRLLAARTMALERIRAGEHWERVSDELQKRFAESFREQLHHVIRRMGDGWTAHRAFRAQQPA